MTDVQKRALLKFAAITAVAAAALVGCGKKDEAAAPAAAPDAPAKTGPLKNPFVYVGPWGTAGRAFVSPKPAQPLGKRSRRKGPNLVC